MAKTEGRNRQKKQDEELPQRLSTVKRLRLRVKYLRLRGGKATGLSLIENSANAANVLAGIGNMAGALAFERARQLGLPQIFTLNNRVYEMYSDGRRIEISNAHQSKLKNYYVKYTKGTVLHAR